MPRALESSPVRGSELSLFNHQYLAFGSRADAAMVWGTDVDAEGLVSYVKQRNASAEILTSVAHVLIQAVGRSVSQFPELNSRIIRGRVYRFRNVNVRMVSYDAKRGDVNIITVHKADQESLDGITSHVWNSQLEIASGEHADRIDKLILSWGPAFIRRCTSRVFWWLDRNFRLPRIGRIDRHLNSSVVVNYLGFAKSPPMRMYKPSKFPDESSLLSVTMGRIERQPCVVGDQVVVRKVAPVFVRADHRVTDAYVLSQFVEALRTRLAHPETMEEAFDDDCPTRRHAA
jgi:hypothetical protein